MALFTEAWRGENTFVVHPQTHLCPLALKRCPFWRKQVNREYLAPLNSKDP